MPVRAPERDRIHGSIMSEDVTGLRPPTRAVLPWRDAEQREDTALVVSDRAHPAVRVVYRLTDDRTAVGLHPGDRDVGVRRAEVHPPGGRGIGRHAGVKVADAADVPAVDLESRVAEATAAHVGIFVAKDGRIERLAALEVAAHLFVPAHRPVIVHDLRT